MTIPSIRRFFVPDPDFILIEGDLKGADAQIVAWDAEDEPLKQLFREGRDLHNENALAFWGPLYSKDHRQKAKSRVHALDYGARPTTLAQNFGTSVQEELTFSDWWFSLHPAIRSWQRRIEQELMLTRKVKNIFGYRRQYFDRIEGLLPEALAWIGQSTTAITINKALVAIDNSSLPIQILMQVHDSLVMQTHKSNFNASFMQELKSLMAIRIPYDDPLIIPVDFKWSNKSWGDMKKYDYEKAE